MMFIGPRSAWIGTATTSGWPISAWSESKRASQNARSAVESTRVRSKRRPRVEVLAPLGPHQPPRRGQHLRERAPTGQSAGPPPAARPPACRRLRGLASGRPALPRDQGSQFGQNAIGRRSRCRGRSGALDTTPPSRCTRVSTSGRATPARQGWPSRFEDLCVSVERAGGRCDFTAARWRTGHRPAGAPVRLPPAGRIRCPAGSRGRSGRSELVTPRDIDATWVQRHSG